MLQLTTNEAVVKYLRGADIPSRVYSLTLPKMGRDDLRAWVTAASHPKTRGLWFYPEDVATDDYFRSLDLFYLVAKELLLAEQSAGCFALMNWVDAVEAQDFRFQEYRFWFLADFYRQGLACPLTAAQVHRLGWQLWEHIEKRQGKVIIHAEAALRGAAAWWPPSIVNLLHRHCVMVPVAVRGE